MLIKEIKRLDSEENVTVKALITQIKTTVSLRGNEYVSITLQDSTDSIQAKMWDTKIVNVWKEGDIIEADLKTSFYGDDRKISFIVNSGTVLDYDNSFTPEFEQMKEYLKEKILEIYNGNPVMKKVLDPLFKEVDKNGDFFNYPAGMAMHHEGKYGLLYHTTSILKHISRLADSAEECYQEKVDRPLLYTAAIVHDFFKIREYTVNDECRADLSKYILTGHIGEALKYIGWLEYTGAINKELSLQLSHIIEAHHGRIEWGSPVVPMTIEALIMFMGDYFDSRMYMFKAEYRRLNDGQFSAGKNKGLDTIVYKPSSY